MSIPDIIRIVLYTFFILSSPSCSLIIVRWFYWSYYKINDLANFKNVKNYKWMMVIWKKWMYSRNGFTNWLHRHGTKIIDYITVLSRFVGSPRVKSEAIWFLFPPHTILYRLPSVTTMGCYIEFFDWCSSLVVNETTL